MSWLDISVRKHNSVSWIELWSLFFPRCQWASVEALAHEELLDPLCLSVGQLIEHNWAWWVSTARPYAGYYKSSRLKIWGFQFSAGGFLQLSNAPFSFIYIPRWLSIWGCEFLACGFLLFDHTPPKLQNPWASIYPAHWAYWNLTVFSLWIFTTWSCSPSIKELGYLYS